MADDRDRALKYLRQHPEGVSDAELWNSLRLASRQRANQLARQLATEGLIVRRPHDETGILLNLWAAPAAADPSAASALPAGAESPSYHLREITLERFKAAFCPEPIALNRFSVVIGRNGSGKSTLLEALQWLDTTIRQDARAACERYYGIQDLINLRSRVNPPYFKLRLQWSLADGLQEREQSLAYEVKVQQEEDGTPSIQDEALTAGHQQKHQWLKPGSGRGSRILYPEDPQRRSIFDEPDRLALSRGGRSGTSVEPGGFDPLRSLLTFWKNAVFLRLSPNRLVAGSPARRRSFDPLLDEEGLTLPALLSELTEEQRAELVLLIQEVLKDITGVELAEATAGRDARINYSLTERMPYQGRRGRSVFPIPSWMLSEGTRRITAIFALLVHDPPPSLLCIEEIENGLDPWTVVRILQHLSSAADRGTQVIVTTHSPWLLDHVELADIIQVRRVEGETRYERFQDRAAIRAFAADIPAGTRYVNEAD